MNKTKRAFLLLFSSNFLGVLNDNLVKNSIIFIAVGWSLPSWLSLSQLISIVSACLIMPYLFLSPLGGHLAVRYSKTKVFAWGKFLEIFVMALAVIAFIYQWAGTAILTVLLTGILSCLYSPSKYSLIRDIGGEAQVSHGSGIFETMAFLGILAGTIIAAWLSDHYSHTLLTALFLGVALAGYFTASTIRVTELPVQKQTSTSLNPILFIQQNYKFASEITLINTAVFGASVFWLIGGMLQMNLVIHCKNIYACSNTATGMVMAITAIGIATGCWLAGKISGKNVNKGLILIGIVGMTLLLTCLATCKPCFEIFSFLIFLLALLGGFFQVPCLSMLQQANIGRKLGDVIAYLNLITFLFVLIGTVLFSVTTAIFPDNSRIVFGVIAIISLGVSVHFLSISPTFRKETLLIAVKLFDRKPNK